MEIALYTFSVMYSPGPINILALNDAFKGRGWSIYGYCVGVGLAMFTGFLVLGYVGEAVVRDSFLPWLAGLGSAYILYLAHQLWMAQPYIETAPQNERPLRFRNGYLLQLLNPKGLIVILPVTTIMFPAAGIHGAGIIGCAGLISLAAMGAPGVYAAGGAFMGHRFMQPRFARLFNRAMAVMLVFVAGSIVYDFFIVGAFSGRPV